MSGPEITVGPHVVGEMVRHAAIEVPGVARVGRGGPGWMAALRDPSVATRIRGGRVEVRVWIVTRPGQALGPLARQVRTAVATTVERLLGLQVGAVTVLVDGVGG